VNTAGAQTENDGPLDVVDPNNPIVQGDPTKPLSDKKDVHEMILPSSSAQKESVSPAELSHQLDSLKTMFEGMSGLSTAQR